MKLKISKKQLFQPPEILLKQFGYAYIYDRRRNQDSYALRLAMGHFPRFHMYLDEEGEAIVFKLHLDQKQVSYIGSAMHSAEYDGDTVAREMERFRQFLIKQYRDNISGK